MSGEGVGTLSTAVYRGDSLSVAMVSERVNQELENYPLLGTFSAEGDGETYIWHVPPIARFVVEDATFVVRINGSVYNSYTMNYETGDITFATVPAEGAEIYIEFNHVHWLDEVVESAIAAAVDSTFPSFYISEVEEVSTDGSSFEYELTSIAVESVRQTEFRADTSGGWKVNTYGKKYECFWDGETKTLRFYTAPAEGSLRVHLISRPSITNGYINLPSRALSALVSYSCYYLLLQKMTRRLRSDVAINTVSGGSLSPRQQNDASNAFYLRYQMQLQQVKMRPWQGR